MSRNTTLRLELDMLRDRLNQYTQSGLEPSDYQAMKQYIESVTDLKEQHEADKQRIQELSTKLLHYQKVFLRVDDLLNTLYRSSGRFCDTAIEQFRSEFRDERLELLGQVTQATSTKKE